MKLSLAPFNEFTNGLTVVNSDQREHEHDAAEKDSRGSRVQGLSLEHDAQSNYEQTEVEP